MKISILGCGPAGLLAAFACEREGHDVTIYSRKQKSKIPGAVFLHERIPQITRREPDGMVKFLKHGSRGGYAKKVYGDINATSSWDQFEEGERPAWSMFRLYEILWMMYEKSIFPYDIKPIDIYLLQRAADLVISTIPAKLICEDKDHFFKSQNIFVLDKCVDQSLNNAIVYNGSRDDVWYRTSNIFGAQATEATREFVSRFVDELGAEQSMGYKPLSTNCDCHPRVARIGRFGRWEKGILIHHAYQQTVQLLGEINEVL